MGGVGLQRLRVSPCSKLLRKSRAQRQLWRKLRRLPAKGPRKHPQGKKKLNRNKVGRQRRDTTADTLQCPLQRGKEASACLSSASCLEEAVPAVIGHEGMASRLLG
mmetsp:Transcript_9001/g.20990  ORF Transcript_9001/g.20990 Transcript_9001/m.20990 type:complete len:106 (+) Transcript_9001:1-318(+)